LKRSVRYSSSISQKYSFPRDDMNWAGVSFIFKGASILVYRRYIAGRVKRPVGGHEDGSWAPADGKTRLVRARPNSSRAQDRSGEPRGRASLAAASSDLPGVHSCSDVPRKQELSKVCICNDDHVGAPSILAIMQPSVYMYAKVKYLPNRASSLCSRCPSRY
jgi:hypothetical protein